MSVLDKNKNLKMLTHKLIVTYVYMEDVQTDIKPNRSVKCSIINE